MIWSACHERGTKKKIWVPDRIRTYDLPNTWRALYPLHLLKSEAIHYVHIWHASCTTARISNVDVALCGERMKGGKFSARWNKCENEMISKSQAWDMNMNLVYRLAVYEFSVTQVDRTPARCLGGHRFEFCRGLRCFLCPTLVTCWSFLFHICFIH